jgi:hypothetical protein
MRHHLREYILPPRAGRGWVARWVASSISRSTKQSFLIDKVRKNEDCHLERQLPQSPPAASPAMAGRQSH